jgi:hypothetical protein
VTYLFIFDPEEDPGVVGVLDDGVEHPGGGSVTSRCKRAPMSRKRYVRADISLRPCLIPISRVT